MEQLQKAALLATYSDGSIEIFDVQFNPTEFSLDKGAQIAEIAIPGLDSPLLQFVRGQTEKLTVDLFFDTTEDGTGAGATPVTTLTDRFYSLVKIEPDGHAPPVCTFFWNGAFPGAFLPPVSGNQRRYDFTGIVESLKQKFTFFSPEGVPLRATLSLVLREYKTLDQQIDQLNLNSPNRSHSHVTALGDTLAGVARRYYRRPGEWRAIAVANQIEDPRRLTSGRFLRIPPIR
ncbi:MAG: peptidoglycan-binding protein [Acidobacteria bacterium]|nr:MAG: peptidoglycan-binding protein [Acidobacteriota bacterium]